MGELASVSGSNEWRSPKNRLYQAKTFDIIPALTASELYLSSLKKRHGEERAIVNFTRQKKGDEREYFFSPNWLTAEVAKESRKPRKFGETPWYHLAGTGFFIKEEVNRLMKGNLETELAIAKLNIESFEDEYLKQMLTLRFNLAWGVDKNGDKKIVCPDSNNVTWTGVTDRIERDGAAHDAVAELERKLRGAKPGAFGVIVSPEGWSGIPNAEGKLIEFPEAQVYSVVVMPDGSLKARTLRYKAAHKQNEALQESLGLTIKKFPTEKERIKGILKNIKFFDHDSPDRPEGDPFLYLTDKMQAAVGGRKEAYEGKLFDEMRSFHNDPDKFSQRHPLTQPLIERFNEFARHECRKNHTYSERERNLQIGLAVTILQLNRLYREKEDREKQNVISQARQIHYFEDKKIIRVFMGESHKGIDYEEEQLRLQERPGCAGGGKGTKRGGVFFMGGFRVGEVFGKASSDGDYDFDHDGTCVVCHQGPKPLGPCDICISCDAEKGGKGAKLVV